MSARSEGAASTPGEDDAAPLYRRTKTWIAWTVFISAVGAFLNYGYQVEAARKLGEAGFFSFTVWNSELGILSIAWVLVQTYSTLTGGFPKSRKPLWVSLAVFVLACPLLLLPESSSGVLLVPTTLVLVASAYWFGMSFARGRAHVAQLASIFALSVRFVIVALLGGKSPFYVYAATMIAAGLPLPLVAWLVDREARVPLTTAPHAQSILGTLLIGGCTSVFPFVDLWTLLPHTPQGELDGFARILLLSRLPLIGVLPLLNLTLSARLDAARRGDGARRSTLARLEALLVLALLPFIGLSPFVMTHVPFWGPAYATSLRVTACALSSLNQILLVAVLATLQAAIVRGAAMRGLLTIAGGAAGLVGIAVAPGLSLGTRLTLDGFIYAAVALAMARMPAPRSAVRSTPP